MNGDRARVRQSVENVDDVGTVQSSSLNLAGYRIGPIDMLIVGVNRNRISRCQASDEILNILAIDTRSRDLSRLYRGPVEFGLAENSGGHPQCQQQSRSQNRRFTCSADHRTFFLQVKDFPLS